jgi:hypothetical protein
MSEKVNRLEVDLEKANTDLIEMMKDIVYCGRPSASPQERYDLYRLLSRIHKLEQLLDMEKRYSSLGKLREVAKVREIK